MRKSTDSKPNNRVTILSSSISISHDHTPCTAMLRVFPGDHIDDVESRSKSLLRFGEDHVLKVQRVDCNVILEISVTCTRQNAETTLARLEAKFRREFRKTYEVRALEAAQRPKPESESVLTQILRGTEPASALQRA